MNNVPISDIIIHILLDLKYVDIYQSTPDPDKKFLKHSRIGVRKIYYITHYTYEFK